MEDGEEAMDKLSISLLQIFWYMLIASYLYFTASLNFYILQTKHTRCYPLFIFQNFFFFNYHILDIWDARNFNKCTYSYKLWYYMYMSNCPWFIFCCWKINRKSDWKLLMSFPLTCAFFLMCSDNLPHFLGL